MNSKRRPGVPKTGIVAGIMLAAGRAIGETMAVLMVAGNVVQHATSLFDPVRTLTANIALEMAYAMNDHRAALFVSGLTLMLLVITLSGVAGWLVKIAMPETSVKSVHACRDAWRNLSSTSSRSWFAPRLCG